MKSLAKIFSTCKQVHVLDSAVCNAWREEILHLILDLDSIVSKFWSTSLFVSPALVGASCDRPTQGPLLPGEKPRSNCRNPG